MYRYPVTTHHICIWCGHNCFGPPKDGPGEHLTEDAAAVEAVAGQGLAGDRYFGVAAHYAAQVTFAAREVFRGLQAEFGRADWAPVLMRRNIVIEGAALNQLIGEHFALDFGEHQVGFAGAAPCAPGAWMDVMLGPGAQAFLRGGGGVRARIVQGGTIVRGGAELVCEIKLEAAAALEPFSRPKLS